MIIKTSNLGMNSERSFSSKKTSSSTTVSWDKNGIATRSFMETLEENAGKTGIEVQDDKTEQKSGELKESEDNSFFKALSSKRSGEIESMNKSVTKSSFRNELMNYLLRLLLGEDSEEYKSIKEKMEQSYSYEPQQKGGMYTSTESYFERESVDFTTSGVVNTADGRTISFDVQVSMSRSFYSVAKQQGSFGADLNCIDPLVINTGSAITELGTQHFYFDLDADGKEEEISSLGSGSGFLALDKNGDGKINDGSELFGTSSGDGFKDLAQYDLDHNGWIDEADEIFQRLKIWYADGSETPKLLGLKEAGVGAICLMKQDTQFSLTNEKNEANAFIRKTGMFLYENGGVGTMNHLDMVNFGA
ncbi:MAG: hypothetical protein K6A30_09910 [Lachnospiraceae bacterium]|nr:hypothetical protein [Lachnospiraceae bacterium]